MLIIDRIKKVYRSYKSTWLMKHAYERDITDIADLNCEFCNVPKVDLLGGGTSSYGHPYHIKKYSGIPQSRPLNCIIEHGLNITSHMICQIHASYPVRYILTFSKYRKNIIEDVTNMTAVPIGPYVAYAEDYRSESVIRKLKERYGKILLVFPSHGIKNYNITYDIDMFAKEINKVSCGFDNVFVCLGAHDINMGMAKYYRKYGYIVVSAGIGNDVYFLSRQRLIFKLSDAVCSNSFTTGLSYALYFNKPIYLFRQSVKYDVSGNNVSQLECSSGVLDELFSVCDDPHFSKLEKQKKWAEYYFGLSEVKSKEEMKSILLSMVR